MDLHSNLRPQSGNITSFYDHTINQRAHPAHTPSSGKRYIKRHDPRVLPHLPEKVSPVLVGAAIVAMIVIIRHFSE